MPTARPAGEKNPAPEDDERGTKGFAGEDEARDDEERDARREESDESSWESFPASDPPAY